MCKNEMGAIEPWSAIGGSDKNAQRDNKTILRLWQKQERNKHKRKLARYFLQLHRSIKKAKRAKDKVIYT
jgi:hypothetical protein